MEDYYFRIVPLNLLRFTNLLLLRIFCFEFLWLQGFLRLGLVDTNYLSIILDSRSSYFKHENMGQLRWYYWKESHGTGVQF